MACAYGQHKLTGKVTDATDGSPLAGVTIQSKINGHLVTATTENGAFQLETPSAGDTLIFSYIGYKSFEYAISEGENPAIRLTPETNTLDELVVMGYTTVRRKDLTGAVSSLGPDQLTRVQSKNVVSALVGTAGVRASGDDAGDIRIRGNRSVQASNSPLLIVDGIPYYGSLNTIDQNDIASIDILKDASSTALYGSRGANGVIVITTKKGIKGTAKLSAESYTGMGVYYARNLQNMNADEYIQFKREANRAVGIWSSPSDDPKIFSSVELDHLGEIDNDFDGDFYDKNSFQTNNTISYQAGNDKGQQKVSFNYSNNNPRGKGTGNSNRYILSLDNDFNILPKLRVGVSGKLSYEKEIPGPSNFADRLFRFIPTVNLYDEQGGLIDFPIGDSELKNPYLDLNKEAIDSESEAYQAFLKGYISYDILAGLSIVSNVSMDKVFTNSGNYIDDRAASYAEALSQAGIDNSRLTRLAWNTVLNYHKTLGDHSIDAFGVFEMQQSSSFSDAASGSDEALSLYKWYNLGALTQNKSLSSAFVKSQQVSYVGRAQYGYKDKYILTGTLRYDGASQLAARDRWDLFPSVGAAWNTTEESFMKKVPVFSNLKLRGSYGVTGNNAISPYATYGAVLSRYTIFAGASGDVPYPTLEPDQLGVETLKWEKTKMVNLGIDFGLFKNRLTGNFDAYWSNTYDLLNRRKLPYTTGFNNVWDNIGTSRNRGLELTLNGAVIDKNDIKWNVGLSFYHNKEELTELYDPRLDKDIQNGWWIGYPVNGVYFDYQADGIWQLDEANIAAVYGRKPGEVKVRDINGDGKITGDDRSIIGTDRPDLSSSLTSTLIYKNFDLMLDIYSEFGATAYDDWTTGYWAADMGRYNAPKLNYWTPDNPSNTTPQPLAGHGGIDYISALGYKSNDFIRLRNVTLGYTFSKAQVPGIDKLRIYLSATDPLRYWRYTRQGGLASQEVFYNFGFNITF